MPHPPNPYSFTSKTTITYRTDILMKTIDSECLAWDIAMITDLSSTFFVIVILINRIYSLPFTSTITTTIRSSTILKMILFDNYWHLLSIYVLCIYSVYQNLRYIKRSVSFIKSLLIISVICVTTRPQGHLRPSKWCHSTATDIYSTSTYSLSTLYTKI